MELKPVGMEPADVSTRCYTQVAVAAAPPPTGRGDKRNSFADMPLPTLSGNDLTTSESHVQRATHRATEPPGIIMVVSRCHSFPWHLDDEFTMKTAPPSESDVLFLWIIFLFLLLICY